MAAEFFLHKSSPTYIHPENADVMNISQFMAQNLRQPPPIPPPPKHTFEISEGESVEIEKIVAAEKKDGQLYYKVKWVKYTWEAEESIQHLPHLIDGYWREHFYQNINQAAIDTTGINLVNNDAEFQARNKSVVNTPDSRDAHKQAEAMVTEKMATDSSHAGVNSNNATVGDHADVILEFTMPQSQHQQAKPEHTYQNRLTSMAIDKKQRRAQPLERKYICQVCNKAFDRNTSLTRHILTHTREKPFKCQLCDKAFSQNAHLKRHILIHIGQKSYQCNKCGKMFIEKGGLARHEATHSTEKPWVCNQCGKAFVLNEYLQRHLFLHTGQKPYQCNECGRLFADGSSWRAHKLTHNKEKKYKCHICQKMLKCKRNFKKHVQAHSEEKDLKHQCHVCDQRFPNKKTLKEHLKKGKRAHSCAVCKMYLENKQVFITHMAIHDPNSATYDPNPKMYEFIEEEDDEEAKEATIKSDTEDRDPKTTNPNKSDTESVDENIDEQEEEEILDDILEESQEALSQDSNSSAITHTSDVPSSFTTLILKAENIEHAATTGNDEEETEQDITSHQSTAPINLDSIQLSTALSVAVNAQHETENLGSNVATLPVIMDSDVGQRLDVVATPTLTVVNTISGGVVAPNFASIGESSVTYGTSNVNTISNLPVASYGISSIGNAISTLPVASYGISPNGNPISTLPVASYGISTNGNPISTLPVASYGISTNGNPISTLPVASYGISSNGNPISTLPVASYGISTNGNPISTLPVQTYGTSNVNADSTLPVATYETLPVVEPSQSTEAEVAETIILITQNDDDMPAQI